MKNEFLFRLTLVALIAVLVFKFGVEPTFNSDNAVREWAKGKITTEKGKYDIIVFGEEPEGIAAAVSAARSGAKTLLISQGDDLGGIVEAGLLANLEANYSAAGELLNRGFFSELSSKLGWNFTTSRYLEVVSSIVKKEKNLEVVYNSSNISPVLESNTISGITVTVDKSRKQYNGRRFIDASRDGNLLSACGVPYFKGSEDLNMKNCFMPAGFNFIVGGVDSNALDLLEKNKDFLNEAGKYETSNINIKLTSIDIIPQGKEHAIIRGLQVYGLDTGNSEAVKKAYRDVVKEAGYLTGFLKERFKEFENVSIAEVADKFYSRETTHFIGEYVLKVSDILGNMNFEDKVAMGSFPVDAAKFADKGASVVGKPAQYSIPLRSMIPLKIENLLMAGNKASYSSLASSSAGTLGVSITEGEAAGTAAVFSIVNNVKPRELIKQNNTYMVKELQGLLMKIGVHLPEFKEEDKNSDEWSYPAIKQLADMGLIAGGINNDFKANREASLLDFATLLLNGVYRLSPDKYSLEFDARLRKYFSEERLTREKAGEILLSMFGNSPKGGSAYRTACEKGYVDSIMQDKLRNYDTLKMEDVFYLSCKSITSYTGKKISE